ncbi:hypothetical protein [Pseudostreptobacillus hongkongensis]|uniref:tetratricopeptide repeat protein n=1 Tax=Pseudostreptobacillus hongkongensis TaxID=1162717 RepID=UPI0028D8438D|nr:hypothetical protein [Pseudostreptobacillus hongkongensis]
MKKKLLILATLIISTLSVAGTKEDYEAAYKKYETSKNIEQYEKDLLEFVSKNKQDVYVNGAKIDLAQIELSKKNPSRALAYYKDILNDTTLSNSDREEILKTIYVLTDDLNERVKVLDQLLKLNAKSVLYQSEKVKVYNSLGKKSEATKLYNDFAKALSENEKLEFNALLIEGYINDSKDTEAEELAKTLANDKSSNVKLTGKYYLGIIEAKKQDYTKAILNLEEASKLGSSKNIDVELMLYNIYQGTGNYEKALEKALVLKDLTKSGDTYLDVIVLAERLKKTKVAEDAIRELRTQITDKETLANINYVLAKSLVDQGLDQSAEKYAKKAISEDKNSAGNGVLAVIYGRKGNKKEALKYLDLAKKAKVQGLETLEKQLNELK